MVDLRSKEDKLEARRAYLTPIEEARRERERERERERGIQDVCQAINGRDIRLRLSQ